MSSPMKRRLPHARPRRQRRQQETGAQRQVRELLEHCLAAAELQLRVQYRRWR